MRPRTRFPPRSSLEPPAALHLGRGRAAPAAVALREPSLPARQAAPLTRLSAAATLSRRPASPASRPGPRSTTLSHLHGSAVANAHRSRHHQQAAVSTFEAVASSNRLARLAVPSRRPRPTGLVLASSRPGLLAAVALPRFAAPQPGLMSRRTPNRHHRLLKSPRASSPAAAPSRRSRNPPRQEPPRATQSPALPRLFCRRYGLARLQVVSSQASIVTSAASSSRVRWRAKPSQPCAASAASRPRRAARLSLAPPPP